MSSDLDSLILKFDVYKGRTSDEFLMMERLRAKFVRDFPPNRINALSVDEYIQGKRSKTSFCYRLETGLVKLGNMKGATSKKFGLYYGKYGNDRVEKYRISKRYGSNVNEALKNIKTQIIKLIRAGEQNDRAGILENPLAPLFRYKLLATYFPESFLDLYSEEHVDFFLSELGLNITSATMLDKQKALMTFKNSNRIMRVWKNIEFTSFLYHNVGHPPSKDEKRRLPEVLPPIEKVKAKTISSALSEIHPPRGPKGKGKKSKFKFNSGDNADRNSKLGLRGENIVFNMEKEFLQRYGLSRKSLVHVSETNDSAGYDIKSLDEKGRTKFIEVKATRTKPHLASFIISSNEKAKAQQLKNYYIYIVFEAHTLTPKVLQIKEPFRTLKGSMRITPISYRIEFEVQFGEIIPGRAP